MMKVALKQQQKKRKFKTIFIIIIISIFAVIEHNEKQMFTYIDAKYDYKMDTSMYDNNDSNNESPQKCS